MSISFCNVAGTHALAEVPATGPRTARLATYGEGIFREFPSRLERPLPGSKDLAQRITALGRHPGMLLAHEYPKSRCAGP
jgi:hypothetical protein